MNFRDLTFRHALIAIGVLAFSVRLIYLLELASDDLSKVTFGDARSYDQWAQEIATGDWVGKTAFYQAPMYPYFLGSIYTIAGRSLFVVRLIQSILGSLACVFLALSARNLFGERCGVVAGGMLAIYPVAIFFDGLIQKTSLGTFLLTVLLFALSQCIRESRKTWWSLAGISFGLLVLTRENALVFAPIILTWAWLQFRDQSVSTRIKWMMTFLLFLSCVLLPVALRNYAVAREFHLTTSQLGPNLFIGNNPKSTGIYAPLRPGRGDPRYERKDATELAEAAVGRSLSPSEVSNYWVNEVRNFASRQPQEFVYLQLRKFLLLCNAVEITDAEAIEVYVEKSNILWVLWHLFHFGVLLPITFVGIVTAISNRNSLLVYLMFTGYGLSVVAFFVFSRYRFPIVPLAILFASHAAVELTTRKPAANWRYLFCGLAMVTALILTNLSMFDSTKSISTTYNNLGIALAEEGQNELALSYYQKALQLSPNSFLIHNNIGNVLARQKKNEEALGYFQKSIREEPMYAEAHNNCANVLARLGKYPEAIHHFNQALNLNPRYPDAMSNLANIYARQQQFDKAIELYERALSIDPTFEAASKNLTIVRRWKQQLIGVSR